VIDPESGLDAVRNVGIRGGVIRAVTTDKLEGHDVIDASGLVVAPGFIDLHWHGTRPASHRFQAKDGVTASFELEVGVVDIDAWYAEHEGREPIHFGAAIGHIPVRMAVKGDKGEFLPSGPGAKSVASPEDLAAITSRIEHGLKRGAVAVGLGVVYTPAAQSWELLEVFRLAAKYKTFTHVHVRGASSAAGPAPIAKPGCWKSSRCRPRRARRSTWRTSRAADRRRPGGCSGSSPTPARAAST
jgi:hypothetical protein